METKSDAYTLVHTIKNGRKEKKVEQEKTSKRKRKVRLASKENNNKKEKKRKTNKKFKLGDKKYKRTYTKGKRKKEILLEKLEHIKNTHKYL